jgi:hypothetical protein
MTRATRRSGFALVLLGILGGFFFWATDPRYGPTVHRRPHAQLDPQYWLYLVRGSPSNVIDAANMAQASTIVGFAGCVLAFGIGGWLVTRRTV